MLSQKVSFRKAVPVWEKDKETVMNHSIVLRSVIGKDSDAVLRLAAHSRYQIFVNGEFFSAGPARAAHGFFRVSEYNLKAKLTDNENVVAVIVAGYNVNSFYLTDQPPFVCMEIEKDGEILNATGSDAEFEALTYKARMRNVMRYSFQRPFTESYVFDAYYDAFMTRPEEKYENIELVKTDEKVFISRNVPYCRYNEIKAKKIVAKGIMIPTKNKKVYDDRSLTEIGDELKGYKKKEIEADTVNDLYAHVMQILEPETIDTEPVLLGSNCCAVYDMGINTTGYIRLSLTAEHDTQIYAVFNEKLPEEGYPDAGRDGCANVVKWALQGGRTYDIVSFEPYTFRYIQIISAYAPTLISNVSQYRECYDEALLVNKKQMPDEDLQKIYDAAVETFVQNSTDIFMDCPSRERAGWLCDSFFTSRVEKELTGKSIVENNYLENFILPEKFAHLPDGMLPMCYPADHNDGCYIPNWAMWYVLELHEYLERSGDRALVDDAKDKVYKLYNFFRGYENADGLLEKLDSWVFVEWSEANSFVQDINYPSNMLYSMFLDAISDIYGDNELHEKAEKLRETIRTHSFDGEFFCDNAVYNDSGEAVRTDNRSETCQYYAFFTGTASKDAYPALYERLVNEFGSVRDENDNYPEIHRSNAFIGNYLRLQILFEDGLYEKVVDDIRKFFLPMAECTGTLWENMTDSASCNHGFASHVICWLNKIF